MLRRRKPRPLGPGERERVVPPAPGNPGWELTAVLLLLAGAACAIAFVVVYVLDRLPAHTQLLGLSLGLSLLFIAAALIVTAHRLIVTEELEDDYPVQEHPEEQELIVQVVEESGLTRRRLLKLALLTAGGALTAAVLTPIASLGPAVDLVRFYTTPWRRGTRLVDEQGKPYKASDIEEDNFYTAFAEGSDKEALPSSLVLVRLPKTSLELPRELAHYPADGIVAYSKICTHAGCALLRPRGLRHRRLPRSPLPAGGADTSARVPVPLLDVHPGRRRDRHVRARRAEAPDAAAAGRPERRAPRRRELRPAGRPLVVGRARKEAENVIRGIVGFVDRRSGSAPFLRKTLRYLFPDHWSFLLGEVALYSFIVLVATGVYLTLFYENSSAKVVYHGPYAPLRGEEMTHAYRSVLEISTTVKAGLLIRQTHHWAADIFIAAIVLHLLRIFFTGAYRKPRELTYWIGLTILMVSLLEGFLGYSIVDDLLSGMGLAIAYGVAMSLPFVGANLSALIWDGPFPGKHDFYSRMYIAHVFLLPALIAVLLTVHLALVAMKHHTQFRSGPRESERKVVGVPTFPGQTPRSLGLLFAVAGVLFLLGGLVQINPIWLWGPYHTYLSTNGAQPDWYLGWLIGGLRLVPGFDLVIGDYTVVPNPFWGGAAFPLAVFIFLYLWPWIERKLSGDYAYHNLLDRPREAPLRTAVGWALLTWVFLVFVAGSSDRAYVLFNVPYIPQIWAYRVLAFVAPPLSGLIAFWVCRELQAGERVERRRKRAEEEAEAAEAAV